MGAGAEKPLVLGLDCRNLGAGGGVKVNRDDVPHIFKKIIGTLG
jgi:hypothetical protein